jgi:hypothetical protein
VWNSYDIPSDWSEPATFIVDRIKLTSITANTTLTRANDYVELKLVLVYEYDNKNITLGNFTFLGIQLMPSEGVWKVVVTNSSNTVVRYSVSQLSGVEGVYGLTAINPSSPYVDVAYYVEPYKPFGYYVDFLSWTLVDMSVLVSKNYVFSGLNDVYIGGAGIIYPSNNSILMMGRLYLGGNPDYTRPQNSTLPSPIEVSTKVLDEGDLIKWKPFYRVFVYDELGRATTTQVTLKYVDKDYTFSSKSHFTYESKPSFMQFYIAGSSIYRNTLC